MDELISSRASSAPQPAGTPANRETANGHASGISPLPEGPVPIGSLVFADELPDGVVVADEVGRIVVFNRVAARLTGLDPAEVIGKFVFDVLPLRDADGRDWWVYADPYHGLPTRTRHPERSLYLADGTEILVSVGYVREPPGGQGGRGAGAPRERGVPGGRPPGLALQRLVISLRGAQQRERLERSRAELVSTVAHELRSPLTSVKGFTATLLNKWGRFTDDQKRVMLETVNADADRVTRLITELLDVSRIESGRMEVHRQLVDLPDRARKIIAGRVAAGDAEDRFRLEVPRRPAGDLAGRRQDRPDPRQPGGKRRPARRWYRDDRGGTGASGRERTRDEPDAVAVSVRDQGEGISPDVAPRVFRQFWRGKPRGGSRRGQHGGGTGLGLYIVKGLVEAHGGTIGVRRAPGGGAEFRFIVPAGTAAV